MYTREIQARKIGIRKNTKKNLNNDINEFSILFNIKNISRMVDAKLDEDYYMLRRIFKHFVQNFQPKVEETMYIFYTSIVHI